MSPAELSSPTTQSHLLNNSPFNLLTLLAPRPQSPWPLLWKHIWNGYRNLPDLPLLTPISTLQKHPSTHLDLAIHPTSLTTSALHINDEAVADEDTHLSEITFTNENPRQTRFHAAWAMLSLFLSLDGMSILSLSLPLFLYAPRN